MRVGVDECVGVREHMASWSCMSHQINNVELYKKYAASLSKKLRAKLVVRPNYYNNSSQTNKSSRRYKVARIEIYI